MAYKDKMNRFNASILLSDKQKEKLTHLQQNEYASFNLTLTKLVNKIVIDRLDSLPDIVDSDADKAKPKTKKGTVNAK